MKGGTVHYVLTTNSAQSRLTERAEHSKTSDEACGLWMNWNKRSRISPWFDSETFRNHALVRKRKPAIETIKTSQEENLSHHGCFYGTARLTGLLDQ
jgi:hypothetical protein